MNSIYTNPNEIDVYRGGNFYVIDNQELGTNNPKRLAGQQDGLSGENRIYSNYLVFSQGLESSFEYTELPFELAQRLDEIQSLKANWDGEGAMAINRFSIEKASRLLSRLCGRADFEVPFIAPNFDGNVQLDWSSSRRSLELLTTPNGWLATGTIIGISGDNQYFSRQLDDGIINYISRFYDWYTGIDFLWPME